MFSYRKSFSLLILYSLQALVQNLKYLFSFLFLLIFVFNLYLLFNLEQIYNHTSLELPFFSQFYSFPYETITDGPYLPRGYTSWTLHVIPSFGYFTLKMPVIINFLTIKEIYFYTFFLLFLTLLFSIFCIVSSTWNNLVYFFSYFLFSRAFYQYMFFYFFVFTLDVDYSLIYLLELPSRFLHSNPIQLNSNFRPLLDSILLNYCIILDLDISILISSEFMALKTILLQYFSTSVLVDLPFYSMLANFVIKHFFSKWYFVLPGKDSYLFFVEFFVDEDGFEFIYFL
jgi:hypothetical protein